MNAPAQPKRTFVERMHLHVLSTHFPLALFTVAFGFQILHLFLRQQAANLEFATNITMIAAVVMMIPTTMTGWLTWKSKYKGARVMIFQRKITIAFLMLAFSAALVLWRVGFFGIYEDMSSPWHWVYLAGIALLVAGAAAEGYYGGRLNHK
jgi:uncharacterized membrane protein